ncbi:MAG: effector protein [Candidatus Phytoplasma australasiaticum]|nr:effector protein [Candidatus Phytoplasma australasiaticum]MDV3153709.1 effector protein [Candidatus Phytoplasma australasiaticum]MDV3180937.1 effector protein [Candidatus Phytoplasma australasiaticum]MDV3183098.1 effector protein [Candidatus Phytoplasma australasiaticum]MDV3185598.1 effector protein [Candidatus Phytoplasma australasiaticum]
MRSLWYLTFLFIVLNMYNYQNVVVAMPPREEFIGKTRIVNVSIGNINILKQHAIFNKYFDWSLQSARYNEDLQDFSMIWTIKDPDPNLLGVFFDGGIRNGQDDTYNLQELKHMGNGANNMYCIFLKNN